MVLMAFWHELNINLSLLMNMNYHFALQLNWLLMQIM